MNTKKCNICAREKDLGEFYNRKGTKDGRAYRCKSCNYKYNKGWFKKVDRHSVYSRNYRNRLKEKAFMVISDSLICQKHEEWKCCNPDSDLYIRCLTLDHINDDGNEHRNEIDLRGVKIYNWVLKHPQEAKEKLQILCMNAQIIKQLLNGSPRKNWISNIPEETGKKMVFSKIAGRWLEI